jgi:hypothetical protein
MHPRKKINEAGIPSIILKQLISIIVSSINTTTTLEYDVLLHIFSITNIHNRRAIATSAFIHHKMQITPDEALTHGATP